MNAAQAMPCAGCGADDHELCQGPGSGCGCGCAYATGTDPQYPQRRTTLPEPPSGQVDRAPVLRNPPPGAGFDDGHVLYCATLLFVSTDRGLPRAVRRALLARVVELGKPPDAPGAELDDAPGLRWLMATERTDGRVVAMATCASHAQDLLKRGYTREGRTALDCDLCPRGTDSPR